MAPPKRGFTDREICNLAQRIYWEAEKAQNRDEFEVELRLDQPTAFMLADLIMRTTEDEVVTEQPGS